MIKLGPITLQGKEFVMYKNNEGFIELYRSMGNVERIGTKVYADKLERHVTNVKDPKDLVGWFKKKKKKASYNPYKDENQMEIK